MRLEEGKNYTGATDILGLISFELVKKEGLQVSSKVLEIGCGVLYAGAHFIWYLNQGNYVGVDPNQWLIDAGLERGHVKYLVEFKKPIFLNVSDFDVSFLNLQFDFVFSHSVLSHAAHWQLDEFFKNISKVLSLNGKILASLRLASGNKWGSEGTIDKKDSKHQKWQYPDNSWFELETVVKTAKKYGLIAVHKPEYTEYFVKYSPPDKHDWIVFNRQVDNE